MEFYFGLQQARGSKISTSWITLSFLYSMLCMWTSVECWSYYYSNTTMDWQNARDWCKDHYTDMVAIQNQDEIAHLNSWLPRKDGYYWIGIRKIQDVWTWVGTNKPLTTEATNWADNEPNNGRNGKSEGKNEDCVEMYIKRNIQPGKWNDERCGKRKTALCYTAACKNDSCYHGECVETINSHKCECFDGFYGEKCEHVVQCEKDEVTVAEKASFICSHKHGEYSYDSSCQYSCEDGYQLSTSNPMRCTASGNLGKWSERPPTCELVQCNEPSTPEKGFMECSDPLGSSSYQSTCVFSCEEGYVLVGSQSNSLQCEASGHWNDSEPSCVAVQCPVLQEPDNGFVSCGEDVELRFIYGNTCNFSCAAGYRLVGSSTVTCTSAAEWSEVMPRCEAITCQKPEGESHLLTQCSHPFNELRPDSTCSFSCDAGFELQGAPTVQCSEDGEWKADIPTCKVVQCNQPSTPAKGFMECSDPLGSSSYQSTCVFSCEEGYVLVGSQSNSLQCEASGLWNDSEPFCVAVQCPVLQEPENGFVSCGEDVELRFIYGNTCNFSCAAGYRLVGSSTVTCTSAAEWSEVMPRCEAITCQKPEGESHLLTQCSHPFNELRPDSTCSFSCDAGFELQGAPTVQCSEDGEWKADIPTCKAVRCPLLEAPVNGGINCSDAELIYNSQCSFTCNQDHTLHGYEVVTCDRHGNWTGEEPICRAAPPKLNPTTMGLAAGGAVSLSGLSLALWLLKRLRLKRNNFELNSSSDIEDHPQVYKNSIDSLI
ncbi:E-selectin [Centroberyx affinis]|uniref:E-selectin n=1 Tax=Centroberyx affinis TaxID=166261 RepID=UPI003A5C4DD1